MLYIKQDQKGLWSKNFFAWLYFKDRLSTRSNLHAKHVLDDDQCQHCANVVEDQHHVFFFCSASNELWERLGMSNIATKLGSGVHFGKNFGPNRNGQISGNFVLNSVIFEI